MKEGIYRTKDNKLILVEEMITDSRYRLVQTGFPHWKLVVDKDHPILESLTPSMLCEDFYLKLDVTAQRLTLKHHYSVDPVYYWGIAYDSDKSLTVIPRKKKPTGYASIFILMVLMFKKAYPNTELEANNA